LIQDIWVSNLRTDFCDIEHLLKDGICIVKEIWVQAHICEQAFCHICNIAFLVSNDILLIVFVEFRLHFLHVLEGSMSLDEANKYDFLIYLREYFYKKLDLSDIPIFGSSKKLT